MIYMLDEIGSCNIIWGQALPGMSPTVSHLEPWTEQRSIVPSGEGHGQTVVQPSFTKMLGGMLSTAWERANSLKSVIRTCQQLTTSGHEAEATRKLAYHSAKQHVKVFAWGGQLYHRKDNYGRGNHTSMAHVVQDVVESHNSGGCMSLYKAFHHRHFRTPPYFQV